MFGFSLDVDVAFAAAVGYVFESPAFACVKPEGHVPFTFIETACRCLQKLCLNL